MKCPACGYENKNAVICSMCQTPLNKPVASRPAKPPSPSPSSQRSPEKTSTPILENGSGPGTGTEGPGTAAIARPGEYDARHPLEKTVQIVVLALAFFFVLVMLWGLFNREYALAAFALVAIGMSCALVLHVRQKGAHAIRTSFQAIEAGNPNPGLVAQTIVVEDETLTVRDRPGYEISVAWGRIREIIEAPTRQARVLLTVVRDDKVRFTIPDFPGSQAILETVRERTATRLLDEARRAFATPDGATFGPVEVARAELRWVDPERNRAAAKKTLPWSDVSQLAWVAGKLVVQSKDGKVLDVARAAEVSNPTTLAKLLKDELDVPLV